MATATPTYDELQEQIKKLTEQAEAIKQSEIEAVLTDMKAKIAKYGLTAAQLGFSSSSKPAKKTTGSKEAVVMYRNGDLTWSGVKQGRKPKWVVEAQAAGEDIEKYRV
ncbi:histone family protein nucleoid-structuring protein H-NS [Burkholderia lata]|uniref:H-NS histone family protein n=1 Tax=Burkholderia lata (strain ATCC 17760 / DSM 23089 / LMG 22485 / NCIMB 9086 / R18194 / 383) TaxID=482957 RepID=UPI0014531615|nr:H-NS histone family protein [Burkholderia lata]VWD46298.1 histone family protein nucleoid-structuring protein H-NS [Burkholderia lata]